MDLCQREASESGVTVTRERNCDRFILNFSTEKINFAKRRTHIARKAVQSDKMENSRQERKQNETKLQHHRVAIYSFLSIFENCQIIIRGGKTKTNLTFIRQLRLIARLLLNSSLLTIIKVASND